LPEVGFAVEPGEGLAAAQKVFAER
jgi:hypothetical protein